MFVNQSYYSLMLRQTTRLITQNGGNPLNLELIKHLQAKPNQPDESASVINFLVNFFPQISGEDGDPNSISIKDINGIARKELKLDLNA